jgi:arylsulfatase
MGKGGSGTISVNGQKVAEGRIEHTQCCAFSVDDTADVGMDEGTPVTEDYKERDNAFTGKILSVIIELKEIKTASTDEVKQAMQEAAKRKMLSD